MTLYSEKVKLSQLILTIESKHLIEKIKNLIKNEDVDFWDELNDNVKSEVEQSLMELDGDGGTPHNKVMEKHAKWLKK